MILRRFRFYSDSEPELEQREFGINKAANKAAKKAWEMGLARDIQRKAGYVSKDFRTVPKKDMSEALREVRENRRGDVFEWKKLKNINGRINEKASVIGDGRNAKTLNSTYPTSKIPRDNGYYDHSDPYYSPSGGGYSLLKKMIKNR